ncbi:unnamed protein product [Chilo suppressalis]|uniref:Cytoskeleton-associated protein 2 C-terminal domain-containing protein n=1 Tax=Chilo suppressalis TaxID=168631 RepID=A0ABN8EDE7_CHISP|nr:unnamed protein product [Chilo suppressalis]
MSSVEQRLAKLREERLAREKARIEKLRELNLKKYNKNESILPKNTASFDTAVAKKQIKPDNVANKMKTHVKNNFQVNNTTKRPTSVSNGINKPVPNKEPVETKPKTTAKLAPIAKVSKVTNATKPDLIPKNNEKKSTAGDRIAKNQVSSLNDFKTRKSFVPTTKSTLTAIVTTNISSRKSLAPPKTETNKPNHRQSVFERLYKPKVVEKKTTDDVLKIQTEPNYLKKIIKNSGLILNNKRHTVFEVHRKIEPPVRRSISAVHFKRINKNEINNCIHKWSSIGDRLNKVHLKEVNEDEAVKQDKVVSAVKSERRKVQFRTPVPFNFNTPKPEELQSRLKNWLQKRGKSLDSYHHLQCFGIHHIAQREVRPIIEPPKLELYDDEDKENIALEHDSDNDSFCENMNDLDHKDMWRRASFVNDSLDFNDTQNSTLTSSDAAQHVDEVLLGALNDLTELLREGFDWEQCARWLRAIRERFPYAPDTAAYWECRAALEETRGDLPASVQCWEEAIAKGTEHSVVESNLDQLLDKFMQLKISPNSGKRKPIDSKMVDVKNVFKSTIIRFAVQQAKLRRSSQQDLPKYTVTPVRRSSRLSSQWSAKRPLQECMSVKHARQLAPVEFVPNPSLCRTP